MITFAESQIAAIRSALASKVLVITGGPGYDRSGDFAHPVSRRGRTPAVRPHGSRRKTHDRSDRIQDRSLTTRS